MLKLYCTSTVRCCTSLQIEGQIIGGNYFMRIFDRKLGGNTSYIWQLRVEFATVLCSLQYLSCQYKNRQSLCWHKAIWILGEPARSYEKLHEPLCKAFSSRVILASLLSTNLYVMVVLQKAVNNVLNQMNTHSKSTRCVARTYRAVKALRRCLKPTTSLASYCPLTTNDQQ